VAGGEREEREGTKSVEEWGEREMGFNKRCVTSRGDHRRSSSRRVIVRRSHLRPRICHDLQFHYFSLILLGRGKNPSFERARRKALRLVALVARARRVSALSALHRARFMEIRMKRERSCTSSIPAESFLAEGKRYLRNGMEEINESAISLRKRK